MNPTGLAQATVDAFSDVFAESRFKAARKHIEDKPCLKPLRIATWVTVETMGIDSNQRWRDMTNGVFLLVGE